MFNAIGYIGRPLRTLYLGIKFQPWRSTTTCFIMIHWSINIYNLCLVQLISKTQQLKFQSFQHFVHSMKLLSDSSHLGWRGSFIFHLNREPFNNYPSYICQVAVTSWMKIFICIFFCIIYKLKNSNKQMAKLKN